MPALRYADELSGCSSKSTRTNAATLLGSGMATFHDAIGREFNDGRRYRMHYVTAREMFNIVRAAEAGEPGNPGDYRDYVLPPPHAAGTHRRVAIG